MSKKKRSLIHSKSIQNESLLQPDGGTGPELSNEEEMRNELKAWISKKYMIKLLNGFKLLLEETI